MQLYSTAGFDKRRVEALERIASALEELVQCQKHNQ